MLILVPPFLLVLDNAQTVREREAALGCKNTFQHRDAKAMHKTTWNTKKLRYFTYFSLWKKQIFSLHFLNLLFPSSPAYVVQLVWDAHKFLHSKPPSSLRNTTPITCLTNDTWKSTRRGSLQMRLSLLDTTLPDGCSGSSWSSCKRRDN